MKYQIRKAQRADVSSIERLYAFARTFMEEHGNPDQWGNVYPPTKQIQCDIEEEKLYLVQDDIGVHGVFYFSIEEDPTYAVIKEGTWRSDITYGVIHRIAGDGSGGILRTAVEFAGNQIGYLRIDTQADNYVMQNALEKLGFSRRGIITIDDGTTRIAYDRMDGVREAQYADLQGILELYLHLHEIQIPEKNELLIRTWLKIIEDPNHHLLIYERDGKIVSSCDCIVIPNLTRNLRPYALVENVVTHREYRGKGYATSCLKYAREIARNDGCYKIMLLTGTKNPETMTFYENAGYNRLEKTAFIQRL